MSTKEGVNAETKLCVQTILLFCALSITLDSNVFYGLLYVSYNSVSLRNIFMCDSIYGPQSAGRMCVHAR